MLKVIVHFRVELIDIKPTHDALKEPVIINSDFEDDHDFPKGEVNENVHLNGNAISDISKDTVVDKGVSLCLKSLRKTRLCRFLISISPPLNTVINRRTISLMLKCLS